MKPFKQFVKEQSAKMFVPDANNISKSIQSDQKTKKFDYDITNFAILRDPVNAALLGLGVRPAGEGSDKPPPLRSPKTDLEPMKTDLETPKNTTVIYKKSK